MKKIIITLILIACGAAGYFGYNHFEEKKITDSSSWVQVGNSEFTAELPENMEASSELYTVSTGAEQIACYVSDYATFSVAKIPYSVNEALRTLDLKTYLSNLKIDGESLNLISVNDGFYYTRQVDRKDMFNNSDSVYTVEAMFKGEDAVYSVAICCRAEDMPEYNDSMIKWLESFKLN